MNIKNTKLMNLVLGANVSCGGGYYASSCDDCSQGNADWCHGDCWWIETIYGYGQCILPYIGDSKL